MDVRFKGASPLSAARKQAASLPGEIWGVTAYFNPARYPNKIAHLRLFSDNVRKQGLRLMIVEAAFADQPFDVTPDLGDIVLGVRSDAILWQKERLLNLGIKTLPEQCDKVAWLDGDILFANQSWVKQTAELLQTYVVVQPFSHAWWVSNECSSFPVGEILRTYRDFHEGSSPGSAYLESRSASSTEMQGHVGFAWAARRELLCKHGLYDRCGVGADTVIAAAMFGFAEYPLLEMVSSPAQTVHTRQWMQSFYEDVQQSVYYTAGDIAHLWHGSRGDRQYLNFQLLFKEANFDPATDMAVDSNGCLRWSSGKTELHEKVKAYFWTRRDDAQSINMSSIAI
jgi:hypothetical protein